MQTKTGQLELMDCFLFVVDKPIIVDPACTVVEISTREVAVRAEDEGSIAFKSALAQLGVNTVASAISGILTNPRNNKE